MMHLLVRFTLPRDLSRSTSCCALCITTRQYIQVVGVHVATYRQGILCEWNATTQWSWLIFKLSTPCHIVLGLWQRWTAAGYTHGPAGSADKHFDWTKSKGTTMAIFFHKGIMIHFSNCIGLKHTGNIIPPNGSSPLSDIVPVIPMNRGNNSRRTFCSSLFSLSQVPVPYIKPTDDAKCIEGKRKYTHRKRNLRETHGGAGSLKAKP